MNKRPLRGSVRVPLSDWVWVMRAGQWLEAVVLIAVEQVAGP